MKTRLSLLASVISLALIAAACGGGSEEPTETTSQAGAAGGVVTLQGGKEFKSILLPKFTGVAVFDQANQGRRRRESSAWTPRSPSGRRPTTASPGRSRS